MSEFVKVGDSIFTKVKGCDYDLSVDKVYELKFDDWNRKSYLVESGDIVIPPNIYYDDKDKFFLERVLNDFNNYNDSTGVMLAGLKGSGKTLTAKTLAHSSGLPIIIVNSSYNLQYIDEFFIQINTPVCILFDEIDKGFKTTSLLKFMDGLQKTTKKLVIFTCNEYDSDSIDQNLIDRCSRIKYFKRFTGISDELIDKIIDDFIDNDPRKDEAKNIIKTKFSIKSFDNILSFVNEMKIYKDQTIEDILGTLNITFIGESDNIKKEEDLDDIDYECECEG